MKADTAHHLMRGEVEHPVGPPQAHSLGDEKVFPVAEQVFASAWTCLIFVPMMRLCHCPSLTPSSASTTHKVWEPHVEQQA